VQYWTFSKYISTVNQKLAVLRADENNSPTSAKLPPLCAIIQTLSMRVKINKLSFNILPSPETNDHEVRILIDNEDFLGSDYLGLDPPLFFNQDNLDKNGELIIGRCSCGVDGCCDYPIIVTIAENVTWTDKYGLNLSFDKEEYFTLMKRSRGDYSWEDIKRRVERLTTDVLRYSKTKDNYQFMWASARINDKQITLSYSKNGDQLLFNFFWDGKTDNNVIQNAEYFLKANW